MWLIKTWISIPVVFCQGFTDLSRYGWVTMALTMSRGLWGSSPRSSPSWRTQAAASSHSPRRKHRVKKPKSSRLEVSSSRPNGCMIDSPIIQQSVEVHGKIAGLGCVMKYSTSKTGGDDKWKKIITGFVTIITAIKSKIHAHFLIRRFRLLLHRYWNINVCQSHSKINKIVLT